MSFEEIVYGRTDARTDGRTDAGRTKCDHKSSPCHYVTGKLKTQAEVMHINYKQKNKLT